MALCLLAGWCRWVPGSGAALLAPRGLLLCSDAPHPPLQDMGAGLAVVPLVGVLETVAIAKAFGTAGGGPVRGWGLRGPCSSHGGSVLSTLGCAPLLAASQNDYRIDANQELLAMGKAVGLIGMGGPIWSRGGDSGDTDRVVHPQPLSFLTAGTANILGSFFSSYPITGSFGRWVYGEYMKWGSSWGVAQRPQAEPVWCWWFPCPGPQLAARRAHHTAALPPKSHSGWGAPGLPAAPSRTCPGAVQAAGGAACGSVFQDSSECTDRGLHPHGRAHHRYCLSPCCSWPRRAPVHGGAWLRHRCCPTGTLVLLSLAYLTSLFCYIPKAALAAVIISAVVPMFDARIFRTLWRVKSEGTSGVGDAQTG